MPIEGGYSDYLAWKTRRSEQQPKKRAPAKPGRPAGPQEKGRRPNKLSYREQQQLDALPAEIESLEMEQGVIESRFCDPDYFSRDAAAFRQDRQRLQQLELLLQDAYAKWEELELKRENLQGRGPTGSGRTAYGS